MTRVSPLIILVGAVLAGCAGPREATTPPVLDEIAFHTAIDRYPVIYPEFHFHAKDGNVIAIHRDLLSTNAPKPIKIHEDSVIAISPDQQKKGAVYVGGWPCGPEIYTADLQAYLLDANGNHSNTVPYKINCEGLK